MASETISVRLSEREYERLHRFATAGGASVGQLLKELATSVAIDDGEMASSSVARLDDAQVLRLARSRMSRQARQRLAYLLDAQQADSLSPDEQHELTVLLQRGEVGDLRKARALREAVARGLIKPLRP